MRLKALGYEIEQGKNGAPEIKGYTKEYLEANSPRSQQIKEHLAEQGLSGAARRRSRRTGLAMPNRRSAGRDARATSGDGRGVRQPAGTSSSGS